MIDVENSGSPIPEVTLERLFEPFFTTKPRGTGLGLAIARNIARAQGGDVTLTVNGPDSVRFSLSLPVAERKTFTIERKEQNGTNSHCRR